MNYLQASWSFLRELFRDFHHTGAVLPSSPFLAAAMVGPMGKPRGPARILEVGPGTGSVTTEIVRGLLPEDHLDIVEINPQFVRIIDERLATEARLRRKRSQIQLINSPVQELGPRGPYDFIISGLPMNNFPAGLVRELFRVFRQLLAAGGVLSFFEYMAVRRLKAPFVAHVERKRLHQVGRIVANQVDRRQFAVDAVMINVPPAWVRHLRFDSDKSRPRAGLPAF